MSTERNASTVETKQIGIATAATARSPHKLRATKIQMIAMAIALTGIDGKNHC
jgi:hypothetical protein